MGPRIRVSAVLRRENGILLVRQEKPGRQYWLLPGGGVRTGESLMDALLRELSEEIGIEEDFSFEGPVAIADSISPPGVPPKHVVHIVFAGHLGGRSLERHHKFVRARHRGVHIFRAQHLAPDRHTLLE